MAATDHGWVAVQALDVSSAATLNNTSMDALVLGIMCMAMSRNNLVSEALQVSLQSLTRRKACLWV